jgi:hypothetical protein
MNRPTDRIWRLSDARARLPEIIERALHDDPQVICRRLGEEVVVARAAFEAMRPTLKKYLLTGGYAGAEEDAFDCAMREVAASHPLAPGAGDLSE